MALALFVREYLLWHYTAGILEIARAWKNLHWFLYNYFSISVLAKSFFAPFHRIQETRVRGFDPTDLFEVFVVNTLMRMVGMTVRITVILLGFLAEVFLFATGAVAFIFFLGAPVFLPLLIFTGVSFLAF